MTTPIERGAEALVTEREQWPYSTFEDCAPDLARAVFESIDRDELAKVLDEHRDDYDSDCSMNFPCPCGAGDDGDGWRADDFNVAAHQVDMIIAHLTGVDQ